MNKLVLAPATIIRDYYGDSFLHNDRWEGYPLTGRISSPQGIYRPSFGTVHQAIDIAAPLGTPIKAPAPGRVVYVHGESGHALGNFVIIEHSNNWHTLYSHMELNGVVVAMGDSLARGAVIGYVGVLGNTNGPHLHFGVATQTHGFYHGSPYLRNPESLVRTTEPLAIGTPSPTERKVLEDLGVSLFVLAAGGGGGTTKVTGLPVEHANGYERWTHQLLTVRGKVTS